MVRGLCWGWEEDRSATHSCLLTSAPVRCCHAHDCCYQKLFDQGCRPYVDHYDHRIENDTEIVCSESLP